MADLVKVVSESFQIDATARFGNDLKFFYTDEDGDTITVTTQADLDEASKAMNGSVKLILASDVMKAQDELSQHSLNRTMSMVSGIVPRNSNFVEDLDKIFDEAPKTERFSEPVKLEKSYTFNVKMDEPKKEKKDVKELNQILKSDLNDMIKKQVEKFCKKQGKKLYTNHLQKKKEIQAAVVHQVECNECDAKEIVGIRYKCTQRPDFNICERCEGNLGQNSQFSFIKIRKPEMAPVHLICQYGNQIPEGFEVELRHAPVKKVEVKNTLVEDIVNSLSIPVVHSPSNDDLKVSELTQSTMASITFADKVD
jgi:hypothetical protein